MRFQDRKRVFGTLDLDLEMQARWFSAKFKF